MTPLKGELAKVAALRDKQELAALLAHYERIGVATPLNLSVHQDNKDSTRYIADIGQSGLGMPNRDYYLADDARLADARAKYQAHIATMLALAGHKDAADEAASIVTLETAIARAHWSAVENRDPVKGYNRVEMAKLSALLPNFDWNAYLKGAGVAGKDTAVNISQPSYVSGLAAIVDRSPSWASRWTAGSGT